MAERVEDEDLADGSAKTKTKDVGADSGVQPDKRQSRGELVWRRRDDKRKVGRDEKVAACQDSTKEVLGNHHLRTSVWTISGENMVLCAIGEAIEQEVDGQEQQTPDRV